jgi:dienelactone hydrolase
MTTTYQHLGIYSDWAAAARGGQSRPVAQPGVETQRLVRESLGFSVGDESPQDVRVEGRWECDGVAGEAVSWSVGYGPRTQAWVLKPAGVAGPLPGVVALHDHGGFKVYGKEKIAAGPDGANAVMQGWYDDAYGGRAWANALARAGFVVLAHDVFLWGSRRFPLADMPAGERAAGAALTPTWGDSTLPPEMALYNATAGFHEHLIEKYCALLGTTFAGVVSYEDRVAANYLAGRADVHDGALGCAGLSGGGCRSALMRATCDRIGAAVVAGMMCTYDGLLDHNVASHTWMFFPAGWPRSGDWPDLAACRAPSPLMVQYDEEDPLFTPDGMRAADARLAAHYAAAGSPQNYVGQFYAGPHKFDLPMQEAAFGWLREKLG